MCVRPWGIIRAACMCAQVPCSPPGPIIIRVASAGGSYIRLVLLNVRAPLLVQVLSGTVAATPCCPPQA